MIVDREWLAKACSLESVVRRHANENEKQRHLCAEVAREFARLGLYRLAAPKKCLGADADPCTQMAVIETISEFDGSSGWNLMIGMETFGLVGPSMATCLDLIHDPSIIMASSTAAVGSARSVSGGWLVNGQWQFVSGVHNAHIFGATVVKDSDRKLENPTRYYAIVNKDEFEIVDTWHVSGLRGSGSHDVRLTDVVVPDSQLVATLGMGSMDSMQLRMPLGVRLTFAKVGVALGIAKAAIAAFRELAAGKTPRFANRKLQDRRFAQRALATAELRYRTCRAGVYEHAEYVWKHALDETQLSDYDKAIAHLLASDAAQAAVEVVELVCQAAGTTANRLDSPLERLARDVRVVRQHATVAPHHVDDVGRVLMGLEPRGILLM